MYFSVGVELGHSFNRSRNGEILTETTDVGGWVNATKKVCLKVMMIIEKLHFCQMSSIF